MQPILGGGSAPEQGYTEDKETELVTRPRQPAQTIAQVPRTDPNVLGRHGKLLAHQHSAGATGYRGERDHYERCSPAILHRKAAKEASCQHCREKSIKHDNWHVHRDIRREAAPGEGPVYFLGRHIVRSADLIEERCQTRVQGLVRGSPGLKVPRSRPISSVHVLDGQFFGEFRVFVEAACARGGALRVGFFGPLSIRVAAVVPDASDKPDGSQQHG